MKKNNYKEYQIKKLEEQVLKALGSFLGFGDDDEEEKEQNEPKKIEKQQLGKKALVFGHSQSGGMGLDFVKILKGQGYDVTRVTKVGAGDRQLGSMIPSETGDPAQYEKVFYFAGANMPGPPGTITANVNKLGGPSKVTVILAPYNMSKEPPDLLSDPNTKGYRNEQELKSAGIKVYRPLFPPDIFWGDKVHVKPGTSVGMEFASDVISGKDNKYSNPSKVKSMSMDFFSNLERAITTSDIYKTVKKFFTSKETGALDSSEGLMKFKAHLNNKQDKMADLIYNEFTSAGLSPNIALAAIVNAYKESELNPNAVGDRGHSVGLFQLHDRGGGSGMSVEERKDPVINTQKMIRIVKGSFGKKLRDADEQGKSVPVLTAIFSRDVERPKNREGNMIKRSELASKWLGVNNVLDRNNIDLVDTVVAEAKNKKSKDDRCVRIAKSKYDAWPSAYASGAVVKCRQGKIWKNIKEEEELEEDNKLKLKLKKGLASALSTMTAVLPPPDSIKSTKIEKPSSIIKKK